MQVRKSQKEHIMSAYNAKIGDELRWVGTERPRKITYATIVEFITETLVRVETREGESRRWDLSRCEIEAMSNVLAAQKAIAAVNTVIKIQNNEIRREKNRRRKVFEHILRNQDFAKLGELFEKDFRNVVDALDAFNHMLRK
jgi:hypothetical protein